MTPIKLFKKLKLCNFFFQRKIRRFGQQFSLIRPMSNPNTILLRWAHGQNKLVQTRAILVPGRRAPACRKRTILFRQVVTRSSIRQRNRLHVLQRHQTSSQRSSPQRCLSRKNKTKTNSSKHSWASESLQCWLGHQPNTSHARSWKIIYKRLH